MLIAFSTKCWFQCTYPLSKDDIFAALGQELEREVRWLKIVDGSEIRFSPLYPENIQSL